MALKPHIIVCAACVAVVIGVATADHARADRMIDKEAISRFDTRFEVSLAGPAGAVGGTLSVPWKFFAIEGSAGWGLTGINLSLMPRLIPLRWGPNAVSVGFAGTYTHPVGIEPLGAGPSWYVTAEAAYQRAVFIDNVVFIGAGVTHGEARPYEPTRDPAYRATWPELRFGWGRRY